MSLVDHICWDCGIDFAVPMHDALPDTLEVRCPRCGSDLVAVDFAAIRHVRPERSGGDAAVRAGLGNESRAGERAGQRPA